MPRAQLIAKERIQRYASLTQFLPGSSCPILQWGHGGTWMRIMTILTLGGSNPRKAGDILSQTRIISTAEGTIRQLRETILTSESFHVPYPDTSWSARTMKSAPVAQGQTGVRHPLYERSCSYRTSQRKVKIWDNDSCLRHGVLIWYLLSLIFVTKKRMLPVPMVKSWLRTTSWLGKKKLASITTTLFRIFTGRIENP